MTKLVVRVQQSHPDINRVFIEEDIVNFREERKKLSGIKMNELIPVISNRVQEGVERMKGNLVDRYGLIL